MWSVKKGSMDHTKENRQPEQVHKNIFGYMYSMIYQACIGPGINTEYFSSRPMI